LYQLILVQADGPDYVREHPRFDSLSPWPCSGFMIDRHLLAALCTLLTAIASSRAAAQAPSPAELPWNAPLRAAQARLARLGFRPAQGQPPRADSVVVFVAERAGVRAELSARFRDGRLWHVFYAAEGDSVAVHRDLDRSAAALAARHGQPAAAADRSRVWALPSGRRFALPAAPVRSEDGRFVYGVAYRRG
jgi:hypothetical protein